MKVYLDSQLATISINEEKHIAYLYWKPFKNTDEYKYVLEQSLKAIEEYKVESWIPDGREAKLMSPEDRKWAEEFFIPEAIKLGVKRIAYVFPQEDVFKKHYATKLKESAKEKDVQFEVFSDTRDAEKWIIKQSLK